MAMPLQRACELLAQYGQGQTVKIGRDKLSVAGRTYQVSLKPNLPLKSFTLTNNPRETDILRFLLGLSIPNQTADPLHHPLRNKNNQSLGRSISAVYATTRALTLHFPVFGFLRNHFIPVNPSPVDLFCNQLLRRWVGDRWDQVGKTIDYFNKWQQLVQTAYAFRRLPPPEHDNWFAEHSYQAAGTRIIKAAYADPVERKHFERFSSFDYEITRARRYLPYVGFMATDPKLRAAMAGKATFRILDVGGGLYTPRHGAPAGRYLIETLQRLFPQTSFELAVTDKSLPPGWEIPPAGLVDCKHDNITYHQHDIVSSSFRSADGQGFDLVICNRVMTQPPFQRIPVKKELERASKEALLQRNHENALRFRDAKANLYASLRDDQSFLIFDQGESHWAEVYQKTTPRVSDANYQALVTRIDIWFLIARLNLASNPSLKNRKFLNQLFSETGVPVFQWAIAEKYLRTLTDQDARQALQLWCILQKTDDGPINRQIKDQLFPAFLKTFENALKTERKLLAEAIDSVANPHTLDLRGLKTIAESLAISGLTYKVDTRLLLAAKLALTGLDQLIPAALGLNGSFFELDGWVEKVEVVSETNTVRKYRATMRFFRSGEPLLARQAVITVLSAGGSDFYTVEEEALSK